MGVMPLPIDQPGDGPHAGGVVAPVVAVGLGEGVVAAQAADGVLDGDPAAGEGAVIGDILGWAGLAARLAARRGTQAGGVGVGQLDIGPVAERADTGRQAGEQARGAQHRQVGGRAAHAVGHIHHRAGRLVHRDLDLQGVLLFLPAVVGVGVGAVSGALDALLEGVDEDRQPRRVAQEGVQVAPVAPPGVGQAQRAPARRRQQRLPAARRPAARSAR